MIEHIQRHDRCALWSTMGTGKTGATLTALEESRYSTLTYPVLALGPLRVARRVWRDEAAKWDHLKHLEVRFIYGDTVAARRKALAPGADIYTINYELIPWLIKELGGKWPFKTVIADEARKLKGFRGGFRRHPKSGKVYYQGAGGDRARALGQVAHRSARFIELTGTPAPRGVEDLWGQAWFLDKGHRLGATFDSFSRRWFRPAYDGHGIEPLPTAQEQIQDRLADLCLSIDLADYMRIEAPVFTRIEVELPVVARKHYRDMERELFVEIEMHGIEAPNAGAKATKCLQLANGACYVGDDARTWIETHDTKLDALRSILEEAGGMPLLVAYQWQHDAERILKAFPQARVLKTERDEDDFRAGRIPLLIAHPDGCGHGIEGFQHATNIIVFFGQWWDMELRDQIIGRIGPVRQMQSGYRRPVFVYDIISKDTLDEDVLYRHATKASVQDTLLHAMKRRTK